MSTEWESSVQTPAGPTTWVFKKTGWIALAVIHWTVMLSHWHCLLPHSFISQFKGIVKEPTPVKQGDGSLGE